MPKKTAKSKREELRKMQERISLENEALKRFIIKLDGQTRLDEKESSKKLNQ
jgi:hypothetical protein